jgi:hypothetical protein
MSDAKPANVLNSPVCPDCGKPMRLETAEPHDQFVNIKHMRFRCNCGRTIDPLIALPE